MATYIAEDLNDASKFFNTLLYTGNGSTGHAITGVGFEANWTWIKNRETTDVFNISTTVSGTNKYLITSSNDMLQSGSENLQSWGSDGFTVGTDNQFNQSADGYVSYNLKAGTTSGISGGTITPSAYSINTISGFGIYAYSGTGSNGTIAHGLGSAPKMIICKRTAGDTGDWNSWHSGLTSGAYYINFNTASAEVSNATVWNSTVPSSTEVSLGTYAAVNASGSDYVMYAFTPKQGYSCFTKYSGNGNAEGPYVFLGFKPAFIMIKETDSSSGWCMYDNKRALNNPGWYNVNSNFLQANDTGPESVNANLAMDFLSNGFKIRNGAGDINGLANSYIVMAFAEDPYVNSNGVSNNAR